jgi:hypothetical protein
MGAGDPVDQDVKIDRSLGCDDMVEHGAQITAVAYDCGERLGGASTAT